jgi:hypothetical protein
VPQSKLFPPNLSELSVQLMAVLLFQNWAGAPIEGEGVQHRRHFGKEASPKHHGGDPEANNELSLDSYTRICGRIEWYWFKRW